MSTDKLGIDILKEYAKKTGRDYVTQDEVRRTGPIAVTYQHGRKIYFKNALNQPEIFVAYSDLKGFDYQRLFSGVLLPINIPTDVELFVGLKFGPQIFSSKALTKTGNRLFDKKIKITGNNDFYAAKIFGNPRIQQAILQFLKKHQDNRVMVNKLKMEFIKPLENKSYIGVFSKKWITESNEIEELFDFIQTFKTLNHE